MRPALDAHDNVDPGKSAQAPRTSRGAAAPPIGAGMAIFRILEATARPGAIGRLSELLVQQELQVVANAPGIVFVQSLRSGDIVLAVSSWRSVDDMQRYLDQPATSSFYAALPDLLMGTPSIRTFEVISSASADGAAGQGESGWRSA